MARKKSVRHPDRCETIARALSAALEVDLRLVPFDARLADLAGG